MLRFITVLGLIFGLTVGADAQTYPTPTTSLVNDYAEMLDDASAARLTETLETMRTETGAEVTLLTLSSVQFYAQDTDIKTYGKALFDAWGIGAEGADTGVLLLVFRDDRELAITLGDAYGSDWDSAAARVIDEEILPVFRNGDFAAGIASGIEGINTRIVAPFHAGGPSGGSEGDGLGIWAILGPIGAIIAGLFGWSRVRAARLAKEPCPQCGKPGMKRERITLQAASEMAEGRGENRITCLSCGHTTATPFVIPMVTAKPDDDEKFGGGKSGDGGASGKW